MKKFSRLALLLLLIVASVFAMTACDDPANTNDGAVISVEESGMPQLQYVLGEELDLSNGVLTVKNGEDVQEIPLNDASISVTGYDKNALGEQTLTIAYNGKTTTITVTVVERMQVIEFVTDYLVGDSFDTSKGRLKVTRDDGSNYTVVLNDSGVEISGFDSSKVGAQTLTAKYTGNDASFECKFTVNVHAVESVEFHTPKKVNYNSHEAGIDLTEGYFTLTGKGGALTRTVDLTEKMVSGFDLTAVNEENSPLTQKLTVSYDGKEYSYDVKLTYTNISVFLKESAAFADMDWTGAEIPSYTAEQGEQALKLMEVYLDLSKADWTYIPTEQALNVARVALMYGSDLIDPDLKAMEGAFTIDEGLKFTCVDRESVEAAIEILNNEDGNLYRVNPILVSMIEELEDQVAVGGMYFGEFGLLPTYVYEELLEVFEHMLEVHDVLVEIPEDWQTVGVETYADEIEAFYNVIFSNDYVDSDMGYIYSYVANWRAGNDAFDILYNYYYNTNNAEALNALASVNLPTSLSEIAYHVTEMMNQAEMINNYQQMDTTLLLYHYHSAVRLVEELKAGDDEMAKKLYDVLPVNSLLGIADDTLFHFDMLMEYIRTMNGGFYQYSGGLLGLETYHNILDAYMTLIRNMLEDDSYEDSAQYGKDLEDLFHMFVELPPTEQYYFLNTINAFYSMNIPPMAFDDTGEYAALMCFFVTLVNEYYRDQLSSSAAGAYNDLVAAIEIYAERMNNGTWESEFIARLDSVQAIYDGMNADDKAAFDKYLGGIYNKYLNIRDTYVLADDFIDLGEWEDEFKALDDAVRSVEVALYAIQQGNPVYGLFYSAYERAQSLVEYILANAPAEILEAYYYEARYGATDAEDGMGTESVAATYEYVMTTYRNMYINYLLTVEQIGLAYDLYVNSILPEFMDACYDLTWNYMYDAEFNKAQVLDILKTFREMTLEEQTLFVRMEGASGYYYSALEKFLTDNYTEGVMGLVMNLLSLEEQYILYDYYVQIGGDLEEILPYMQTVLTEVKTAYDALSAEDKASFADFEEMYTFYVTLCEQALAA